MRFEPSARLIVLPDNVQGLKPSGSNQVNGFGAY